MRFLTVARLLYDKGYAELIESSKQIKTLYPDIEFMWAGNLDYANPAFVPEETLMEDVNHNIINFLGYHKDIIKIIKNSDCIILPSYHEGLSRVLMEALAMSKPIITTDIPGCRETVIDGENGFLCKPKDVDSLVDAIKKFISLSDEQRIQMGTLGRKLAEERFDVKNVIKVYDQIIDEALSLKI